MSDWTFGVGVCVLLLVYSCSVWLSSCISRFVGKSVCVCCSAVCGFAVSSLCVRAIATSADGIESVSESRAICRITCMARFVLTFQVSRVSSRVE